MQGRRAHRGPSRKIIRGEILPNLVTPLMVETGLRMTWSIVIIAGLSFIGFGLQPPAPNWGLMLNENRIGLVSNPWSVIVPALLIALLTIGLNTFTDGLGRALIGVERAGGAVRSRRPLIRTRPMDARARPQRSRACASSSPSRPSTSSTRSR